MAECRLYTVYEIYIDHSVSIIGCYSLEKILIMTLKWGVYNHSGPSHFEKKKDIVYLEGA